MQISPQPPRAYAAWPPGPAPLEQNLGASSSTAAGAYSAAHRLHLLIPAWKPSGVPLHLKGGWGRQQSCPYMRDAAGPAAAEQTLSTPCKSANLRSPGVCCIRGTEHKIHHWHQLGQTTPMQLWGRRTFRQPSHPLLATAASLVTNPVSGNCLGDPRASQTVRKLPGGRLWLPTNTPGSCCCYVLPEGLAGA